MLFVYPNTVAQFSWPSFVSPMYYSLQNEQMVTYIKPLLWDVISALSIKTSPVILNLLELFSFVYLQQAQICFLQGLLKIAFFEYLNLVKNFFKLCGCIWLFVCCSELKTDPTVGNKLILFKLKLLTRTKKLVYVLAFRRS